MVIIKKAQRMQGNFKPGKSENEDFEMKACQKWAVTENSNFTKGQVMQGKGKEKTKVIRRIGSHKESRYNKKEESQRQLHKDLSINTRIRNIYGLTY